MNLVCITRTQSTAKFKRLPPLISGACTYSFLHPPQAQDPLHSKLSIHLSSPQHYNFNPLENPSMHPSTMYDVPLTRAWCPLFPPLSFPWTIPVDRVHGTGGLWRFLCDAWFYKDKPPSTNSVLFAFMTIAQLSALLFLLYQEWPQNFLDFPSRPGYLFLLPSGIGFPYGV